MLNAINYMIDRLICGFLEQAFQLKDSISIDELCFIYKYCLITTIYNVKGKGCYACTNCGKWEKIG